MGSFIRIAFAQPRRRSKRAPRRRASIAFQNIERRLLGSPALRAGLNGDAAARAPVGLFAIAELDFCDSVTDNFRVINLKDFRVLT